MNRLLLVVAVCTLTEAGTVRAQSKTPAYHKNHHVTRSVLDGGDLSPFVSGSRANCANVN